MSSAPRAFAAAAADSSSAATAALGRVTARARCGARSSGRSSTRASRAWAARRRAGVRGFVHRGCDEWMREAEPLVVDVTIPAAAACSERVLELLLRVRCTQDLDGRPGESGSAEQDVARAEGQLRDAPADRVGGGWRDGNRCRGVVGKARARRAVPPLPCRTADSRRRPRRAADEPASESRAPTTNDGLEGVLVERSDLDGSEVSVRCRDPGSPARLPNRSPAARPICADSTRRSANSRVRSEGGSHHCRSSSATSSGCSSASSRSASTTARLSPSGSTGRASSGSTLRRAMSSARA